MTDTPQRPSAPARRRTAARRAAPALDARARELDLLGALARRAAAAATPDELFGAIVSVLHGAGESELVLVASALDGPPAATVHLARPIEEGCLARLVAQAVAQLDGCASGACVVAARRRELDDFDPGLAPLGEFAAADVALLPVRRGRATVACLLWLGARGADEGRLRLLHSATNQAALHLERLLSARDAEARRLRAVLDSMPQAVVVTGGGLAVEQHNRAAGALLERLGLARPASLGPLVARLGLAPLVERVTAGGAAVAEAEVDAGPELTIGATVSPLAAVDERRDGLVFVLADVTERRRLQRRLAQSEKMSSLGQLISGTAHELNNPLASVLGYAQLLRASAAASDPELARRVEVLHREAERCRRIVHNLLAFARQRAPERRRLDLNRVVDTALGLLGYQLRADGVHVERELCAELPSVEGDEHQLQQVLVNLLANARDAIRQQGEGGRIRVATAADVGGVTLDVEDDGPGIPAEARERVFDPFYTTKPEGQGTGLGLAIVYGIVSEHGGTVEALPAAGRGARFRLRLPAGGRAAEAGPRVVAADGSGPRGRVLVVDDEVAVAEMLREALTADGHVVECAASGRDALERAERESWDVVLADLRMPEMGGVRLHAELARRRPELAARLVLATGDTVSDEPERAASRAGVELVRKPFDLDELRALVRRRVAAARSG